MSPLDFFTKLRFTLNRDQEVRKPSKVGWSYSPKVFYSSPSRHR
nr:MAG TPA: hypothetical protein [Caudoviricetes sp.]